MYEVCVLHVCGVCVACMWCVCCMYVVCVWCDSMSLLVQILMNLCVLEEDILWPLDSLLDITASYTV